MPWFFFGLAFAFLNAMTMLINQKYRLDGRLISGMRGIGVAILYFPAIFFVSAPSSGVFWLLIILEGAISTFFNARLYASAAKYGAGSTSRMNVLAIAFGMVFWWIIDWRRFISLAEDPIVFVGIMAALALTGAGFLAMSKGGFKKGEISYMMPAVVVLAAMMINRKELMSHADLLSASVFYCEVSILFSGVANLGLYAHGNGSANLLRELSKSSVVKAGIIMAAVSSGTILTGNLAALYAPNPAYVSVLTLTSPLWVMLINWLSGIREKINSIAFAMMFAGVLMLLYFGNVPMHASF